MSNRICPDCGSELPAGLPDGTCPHCLLSLALPVGKGERSDREPPPCFDRAFGDYELLQELARGGMGVVFRARQISLNRVVAVKMLHGGVFATADHVKRLQLEARAAAQLDHPNIVPIYEVSEYEGQPFFSMRLVEGGTLLAAMKRRPYAPREAAELVKTIATAVHVAHQRGVLHRDLKPTNILLDAGGQPHITDFGLAKILEDESNLTMTLAVMGTPAYMSPEQAAGMTKHLTGATDIYSLGVVLYEMLSGHPPFGGDTPAEVMRQVMETEPTSPRRHNRDLDLDLETICLKCLEKSSASRYASAQELANDLDRYLNDEPIRARAVNRLERFWRKCRRKPVVTSLTIVVICLLAIVFGLFKWNARPRDAVYWNARGEELARHSQLRRARDAYTKAIDLANANTNLLGAVLVQARRGRSRVFLQMNQFNKAALDWCLANNIPMRDGAAKPGELDLSPFYDGRVEDGLHDGKGWRDRGLTGLPQGLQFFGGVRFDVRGNVQMRGAEHKRWLPQAITNVPVNMKFKSLYALMASGWAASEGDRIGAFVLHYVDGRSVELPIQYSIHVRDTVCKPVPGESDAPLPSGEVAWVGTNALSREHRGHLRLYKSTWKNPRPDAQVQNLDFISDAKRCTPFVIAITVE